MTAAFFAVCTCDKYGTDGCVVHADDKQGAFWKAVERGGSRQTASPTPQHDESCECPPGAWHLRSCDVVWWPEHMREEA